MLLAGGSFLKPGKKSILVSRSKSQATLSIDSTELSAALLLTPAFRLVVLRGEMKNDPF